MNADFKIYLRGAFKQFLISLIFPLIVYFIVNDKSFIIPWILLDFIGLFPGYYKYKERILFEKRLKARGLTIEDVNNIEFVKQWEEIRQKGVVKYNYRWWCVFWIFFKLVYRYCFSYCISRDIRLLKGGAVEYVQFHWIQLPGRCNEFSFNLSCFVGP